MVMWEVFSTPLFSIANKGGGGPGTPTDLETSEVTQYSFRATWMPPDEPVERFRIEYVPVAGGKTEVVSYKLYNKFGTVV